MKDSADTARLDRIREFFASACSVWAEEVCDRLETDERFLKAVEVVWISGLNDLNEDDASWSAVLAVLATLSAEREAGDAKH